MLNESLERGAASFLPAVPLPTEQQVSSNHSGLKQQVLILLHGFCKPGIRKQLGCTVLFQVSPVARVEVIYPEGYFMFIRIGKPRTAEGWSSWPSWAPILSQHGPCPKSLQQGGFGAVGLLTWRSSHRVSVLRQRASQMEATSLSMTCPWGSCCHFLSHSVA